MITVISAGTSDYREMMAENRRRCEALGYRYVAHDLELSPDLQGALPPCTFKPALMAKVLQPPKRQPFEYDPMDDIIAWMDADAIVVRPLEPLLDIEFDVAVTLREPDLIGTTQPTSNYLNAGVVFFRNTPQARGFIQQWSVVTEKTTTNDQFALNKLLDCGQWSDDDWRRSYGTNLLIKGGSGAWCHILRCSEWNFSNWNCQPGQEARILHFKHGWRAARGEQWWKNLLAGNYAII